LFNDVANHNRISIYIPVVIRYSVDVILSLTASMGEKEDTQPVETLHNANDSLKLHRTHV